MSTNEFLHVIKQRRHALGSGAQKLSTATCQVHAWAGPWGGSFLKDACRLPFQIALDRKGLIVWPLLLLSQAWPVEAAGTRSGLFLGPAALSGEWANLVPFATFITVSRLSRELMHFRLVFLPHYNLKVVMRMT